MTRGRRIWLAVLRIVEGLLLFGIVSVSILWAAICFSAAQFQVRIAELTISGTPLTVWRVEEYRQDIASWTSDVREHRLKIETLRIKKNEADRIINLNEPVLKSRLTELRKELETFRFKLPEALIGEFPPAAEDTGLSIAVYEVILKKHPELGVETKADFERLQGAHDGVLAHRRYVDRHKTDLHATQFELEASEIKLKARVGELSRIFGTTSENAAPEFVERLINTAAELEALRRNRAAYVYDIALFTNDMLVLTLVITMGALGSALFLVADFVKNENVGMSFTGYAIRFVMILVRLAFGAVTAMVVFVVAKSGIPILADTAKVGGSAPINPYFISFLAIVSGLMSDRALETVRSAASNLLRSSGAVDRYARMKIDDAFQGGRTPEELSSVLGIDAPATRQLFSGRDPVSPERQTLIAAYLNKPVRDVFSDLSAG